MKPNVTGLKRSVDSLGRVVIPHEFRKALALADSSSVSVMMLPGEIRIVPYYPHESIIGQLDNIKASLACIAADYRHAREQGEDRAGDRDPGGPEDAARRMKAIRAEISEDDVLFLMAKTDELMNEFKTRRLGQIKVNRYTIAQDEKEARKTRTAKRLARKAGNTSDRHGDISDDKRGAEQPADVAGREGAATPETQEE